ncbi:MAG: UbiA family prenyltransferase [Methanomicrobiaceae archaeon]|nr:UbiA family prenyltransferase [Methanomicrobiaceae archaeon]MDD5418754.1 UbiA family prenyltransferase [Methanomicrobiaceae archaeon]
MRRETVETFKAYVDLTRAQFFFVWPLLFCSGLFLAFEHYDGFTWSLTIRAALIGLFGFEAGLILNDYVDREADRKDIERDKLTKYWRLFRRRPVAEGLISPGKALGLFLLLAALALALIATLPPKNALHLTAIMAYSYAAEYFYQVKKRDQTVPVAQILGRTDFALFPVAGYLCLGSPDATALLYFLFFYPFALAHLGVNDIADMRNDEARGMKTVPVLYGLRGAALWVLAFTAIHLCAAVLFAAVLPAATLAGFAAGFVLLGIADCRIARAPKPETGLAVLPLFHLAMLLYTTGIILGDAF